jgi:hypothetical protein
MRGRWSLFWLLLLVGLGLSVLSVLFGSRYGFLFLLLPLVFPPFRIGKNANAHEPKRCGACGFETLEPDVHFCPRDGTALRQGP